MIYSREVPQVLFPRSNTKVFFILDDKIYMEYRIIIQEHQSGGGIYIHTLHLDPAFLQDALEQREAGGNSYCLFIPGFCQN